MNGISILLKWPSSKTLDIQKYKESLRLTCDLPKITDIIDNLEDDTHPENDLLILDPDIVLESSNLNRLQETLYSSYFIGAVQPQTNYVMRSLENVPNNKLFAECAEYAGFLEFSKNDDLIDERFFHDYCVLVRGSIRKKLFGTATGVCTKLRSGMYQGADLALSIQRFGYTCVTSRKCFFFRGKNYTSDKSDSLKKLRHDECLFRKLGRKIKSERLSVVIPTDGNTDHLKNVLKSLHKQTCTDFDIVIQDNIKGSSITELLDTIDDDFRCHISYNKNSSGDKTDSGYSIILTNVTTNLVWIISEEDIIKKDAVETIYKTAFSFPDSGILYFPENINYENLKLLPMQTFYSLKHFIRYFSSMSAERDEHIGDSLLYQSDKVFRLPILVKNMSSFYKYACSDIPTTAFLLKGLDLGIACSLVPQRLIEKSSLLNTDYNLYDIIHKIGIIDELDLLLTSKQRSDLFAMFYKNYKIAINNGVNRQILSDILS